MKRFLLSVCLILLALSCGWEDGLDYDELHVSALRSDGVTYATSVPQDGCVTLPLLLGSQIEETVTLDNQIVVDVSATRDRARVRITSSDGATQTLTILAEDLRRPTDPVPPISIAGFEVQLRSTCPSTTVPH